ncbi:MAG: hypothetical protein ACRDOI_37690 [Trebonia sp.]
MAPPIPGLSRPASARKPARTPADVALGILAVLALAALTVGVPLGLVLAFGLPVPHLRSVSALTTQLDLKSVLKILAVVVWLAWIQLVWCVIVEIRAAIRNVGVPGRVPLAGGTQPAVRRLVTAALLLFSATVALSPAFTHSAAPPRPAHSVSAQAQQSPRPPLVAQDTAAHQAPSSTEKIYVVKPPAGRYHESMWEIAQNHLGGGRRYNEIFQLNKDRIQPDGTKLTIASLIRPGWVLSMPSDAHGPGIETVAQHTGQAPAATVQQDEAPTRFDLTAITDAPATAHVTHAQGSTGASVAHSVDMKELAAASLLAAGLLSALGRRRRERLWQRAFGRRLTVPEGNAAAAEQALRLGADDPAVALLDNSLRHLSRVNAARRRPLPTVFAAHLSAASLALWVAPPDLDPPAPWRAEDEGQLWRIESAAAGVLDAGDALAPYPGLVTLGSNDVGRVLVDLEVAHGLIAVHGPGGTVRDMLAALAVELVTNRWSDSMRVTLVGFGDGLENISPERVRVAASLDDVLPSLAERAEGLVAEMALAGVDSVLTGRALSSDPGAWEPHYLIMGIPPTPEQAAQLLELARTRHRTALGFVVAGEVPGASWTWHVAADGRLSAPALSLELGAQLLPAAQYEAVVELFREPRRGDPPVSDPGLGAAPSAHLAAGFRAAVEVGLLGPVTVSAPGPLEADRAPLATEVVVYLAAHPGGVHLNVLTGAVWPRGVPPEVRDAVLGRVAAWLGTDGSGNPNLVTDRASGRLSLGPGVRVDWAVFRALVARAGADGDEEGYLRGALNLVRGQALDGYDPSRYTWLVTDTFGNEVLALVADTAHQLAELRLGSGDPAGAMVAARAGLRLAFDDEALWQDLLRAAAAVGSAETLRSVVEEISARVALDEVLSRMAPETEALIDELMPSWRNSAA